MRRGRAVRWFLGAVLLLALLAAAIIYGMICMIPSKYPRDTHRTVEQQEAARAAFVSRLFEFGDGAGKGRPFTWSIQAADANVYLASMDAIASLTRAEPVHPTGRLEEAGFTGPAVAMRDGVLTLMVNVKRYDKIFSVDLGFDFNDAGEMTARIVGVRVGVMPVPRRLLDEKLAEARAWLAERAAEMEKNPRGRIGPVRMRDVAAVLRAILDMINQRHVRPVLLWPDGPHRVLVRKVEITEGRLTLHCVPADRRPAPAPSGRRTDAEAKTRP